MSPLIETLCIRQRNLENVDFHNKRLNRSRGELFNCTDEIDLKEYITIPPELSESIYRCRVTYEDEILNIEIIPYEPKKRDTLKCVYSNTIDYSYKYKDRNPLMKLFDMREDCDDILIIKNGFVSDTSSANIIFRTGSHWYTPTTPLLKGTMRDSLITKGIIREKEIRVEDIHTFEEASIINTFLPLGEAPIKIKNILF